MRSTIAALLAAALAATLLGTAYAGGGPTPSCCLCTCLNAPTQCTSVGDQAACPAILATCNNLNPAVCDGSVITNGTCAGVPACAGAAGPAAAAPSLDATGLAIAVIVLGGLAGLRLRRRPAKQRARR